MFASGNSPSIAQARDFPFLGAINRMINATVPIAMTSGKRLSNATAGDGDAGGFIWILCKFNGELF